MLKTIATLALSFLMLATFAQDSRNVDAILANQDPIFVHYQGFPLRSEVPPVIVNSRTFVELRSLFEALDIDIYWDGAQKKVTGITNNGTRIELYIGRRDAYINGSYRLLDAAPFIATPYERTMIPLSFVATATGASVDWLGGPRTVDVWNQKNRYCAITDATMMADFLWRGYYAFGEAGPISLVRGTMIESGRANKTVYVVGLSGTDIEAVNQNQSATGILEDLIVGGWQGQNAYLTAVRNVILSRVPAGSNIVLAGHSLGGMIAQQAAADSTLKNNYNIINTVTFGSPLIGALAREGEVRRLGDNGDIVPLLSVQGTILQPWQVAGLNIENGGYFADPLGAHLESYRRYDVWGSYDATGVKWGGRSIVFWSSNVSHFAAPRP